MRSSTLYDVHQTEAWFRKLLAQWREAWSVASPDTRERVSNSLVFLEAPLQATIYIRVDAHLPIQASVIFIRRDPTKRDGDLKVITIDDVSVHGYEDRIASDCLEQIWATMRANWTPDRPPDPPPEPCLIPAQRIDDQTVRWHFGVAPAVININKLVAFSFRDEPPAPSAEPPITPTHGYALGMERERKGAQRWLSVFAERFFPVLGIEGPWWCAPNLPRPEVFGDGYDGDVDLVAGPLEFSITEADWSHRFECEARRCPLDTQRAMIIHMALVRACAEGLIIWPLRMDMVVACEAKVSWFDPSTGKCKATHAGEASRVRGQLKVILEHGVDRVAFLHLVTTKPGVTGASAWGQAAADCAQATEAFGHQPPLFGSADLPLCGYYRVIVGAVPHKSENLAGAGGSVQILQAAQPNAARMTSAQTWRNVLRERLARCPRPMWPNAYVNVCPRCGKWGLSHVADVYCSCSPGAAY
ncbi:MAG: hypothetical protein ACYDHY_13030 [Acidiferrobacterales bacterium]